MSEAPAWQPDSAAAACFLCSTKFTFFNRRHHCRKCGRLVCADCSAQSISYFTNSQVLHADGPPLRAQPHQHYRTCDDCVDEVRMIRRALFDSTPGPDSVEATPECASVASATKYTPHVNAHTDLALTLLNVGDTHLDNNLCPVCAVDLLPLYVREQRALGGELSHAAYEAFKEAHVGDCLVAFDFNLDHLRLALPPSGLQARNRMLVYNIPPIPRPSYEIIETQSQVGLLHSTATVQAEKDDEDECVICLDDLKPGDKVGRLECLCVFHYRCIKDWFNKKGYGECPVHYLHH